MSDEFSRLSTSSVDNQAATVDWSRERTSSESASSTNSAAVPPTEKFTDFKKIAQKIVAPSFQQAYPTSEGRLEALQKAYGEECGLNIAAAVESQISKSNNSEKAIGSYTAKKPGQPTKKLGMLDQLNKSEKWIEGNIFPTKVSSDGSAESDTVEITTTLLPASQEGVLQKSYQDDSINGISSKDAANENHSVNLWRDTFVWGGKQLFSCIRSGLCAAMKVPEKMRQAAFDCRLNENIAMALEGNRAGIDKKLSADVEPGESCPGTRNNPISVELLDVGLLSNYNIFGRKIFGFGSENKMKKEQFKMLDKAEGIRQVLYKDAKGESRIIHVNLTIHALHIGVQRGDGLFASSDDIEKTIKSATYLFARALTYVDDNKNLDPQEREVITTLAVQCRKLAENKTYLHENGGDYYALPARLALLADKIGIHTMIHCKSGKDRTARLIEETKFLAVRIEQNKNRLPETISETDSVTSTATNSADDDESHSALVPLSGALSPEEKKLLIQIAKNSGNQKVQELNEGVSGNKQGWQFGKRLGVYGLAGIRPDPGPRAAYEEYTSKAE